MSERYDIKCFELAEYFLGARVRSMEIREDLALHIQDAVDSWFAAHPRNAELEQFQKRLTHIASLLDANDGAQFAIQDVANDMAKFRLTGKS